MPARPTQKLASEGLKSTLFALDVWTEDMKPDVACITADSDSAEIQAVTRLIEKVAKRRTEKLTNAVDAAMKQAAKGWVRRCEPFGN